MAQKRDLLVWTEAPGKYKRIIENAAHRFKAKTGFDGKIDIAACSWDKDYVKNLESYFGEGKGPDVFSIEPGGPLNHMVQKGFLKPLDKYFDPNRFNPLSIDSLSIGSTLYALPVSMNNMQLFINKKLVEKYKIDYPDTIDDLKEIATYLQKKDLDCISTGFGDRWAAIDTFVVLAQQLSKKAGKNLIKEAEKDLSLLTRPEFIMVMDQIKEMSEKKIFPKDAAKINYHSEAFERWCAMKAVFLWPGNNAIFSSIPKNIDFDAAWFPRMGEGEKVLTGGVALCWGLFSKSDLVTESIGLLKEMASDQTRKELLENNIAHSGVIARDDLEPGVMSKINLQQNLAMDRRVYNPVIYDGLGEAVCSALDQGIESKEALKKIKNISY